MDSGSHTAHLAYTFTTTSSNFKCVICHTWDASYSLTCVSCHNFRIVPEYGKHANYQVDVVFDSAFSNASTVYNGTPAPGDGYSNCSNSYCHSNGTSVSTGSIPGNASPNWGTGALPCNLCHGNPPGYSNGSPKANSHADHASHSVSDCSICHYSTTTTGNTITDKSKHVNKIYDLQAKPGYTFTYTYNSDGGTCTGNSCHADKQWGH